MLHAGRGIVLGFIKYGESSVIARIFTEKHGLVPFMVQGVFRKKARISASQLQPLTLLDMVYYFRDNKQVQNIKEVRANPPLNIIQSNVVKSSLAIFASDVLKQLLKNTGSEPDLFHEVYAQVVALNGAEEASAYWPHHFLIEVAKTQGFAPMQEAGGRFFHLGEGKFTNIPMGNNDTMQADETALFVQLLERRNETANVPRDLRNRLLDKLISYCAYHSGGFAELKSLSVIRNILR
ncbi:DNA repair protein RecO [bacterium]|nr:DNA repair protein RecO [bacterium]